MVDNFLKGGPLRENGQGQHVMEQSRGVRGPNGQMAARPPDLGKTCLDVVPAKEEHDRPQEGWAVVEQRRAGGQTKVPPAPAVPESRVAAQAAEAESPAR